MAEAVHGFHSMSLCRDTDGRLQWPVLCATTQPAVYILRRKTGAGGGAGVGALPGKAAPTPGAL